MAGEEADALQPVHGVKDSRKQVGQGIRLRPGGSWP